MSPKPVWRHYLVALALVLGLVSAEAPWLSVTVPTGAAGQAGWSGVASASFSLALAAVAAWGASLLTPPRVTRVLGGAQVLLASGSGVALGHALVNATDVVASLADEASGVIGAFSASETSADWSPGWIAASSVAIVAIALSGITAVWAPGGETRSEKYDRPEQRADVDPWDALSDGHDPTDR